MMAVYRQKYNFRGVWHRRMWFIVVFSFGCFPSFLPLGHDRMGRQPEQCRADDQPDLVYQVQNCPYLLSLHIHGSAHHPGVHEHSSWDYLFITFSRWFYLELEVLHGIILLPVLLSLFGPDLVLVNDENLDTRPSLPRAPRCRSTPRGCRAPATPSTWKWILVCFLLVENLLIYTCSYWLYLSVVSLATFLMLQVMWLLYTFHNLISERNKT